MHQLANKLDQLWRLIGTGLSFAIFGIAGLILGIFVFPLFYLLFPKPATRQLMARRLVGHAFGAFIRIMRGLGALTYRIEGLELAGRGYNQLIIANHPTLIDVVFLVSLFPLADCVIKESVIRNPFMRGVVLPAKYISSDDPAELMDSCVDRLKNGGRLLLFPEGTRTVDNQSLTFKLGAASVAVRADAEILPVVIKCTQRGFLAKNVSWYRVPPERPFFSIEIKPPMSLKELIHDDLNPRQATRTLNAAFLDYFESRVV